MIKIKTIVPQQVEAFDPNGHSIGTVNEYEFLDLRVQIKKEQLSGFFIKFNDQIIRIDRNGTLENYPNGLFDLTIDLYSQLI